MERNLAFVQKYFARDTLEQFFKLPEEVEDREAEAAVREFKTLFGAEITPVLLNPKWNWETYQNRLIDYVSHNTVSIESLCSKIVHEKRQFFVGCYADLQRTISEKCDDGYIDQVYKVCTAAINQCIFGGRNLPFAVLFMLSVVCQDIDVSAKSYDDLIMRGFQPMDDELIGCTKWFPYYWLVQKQGWLLQNIDPVALILALDFLTISQMFNHTSSFHFKQFDKDLIMLESVKLPGSRKEQDNYVNNCMRLFEGYVNLWMQEANTVNKQAVDDAASGKERLSDSESGDNETPVSSVSDRKGPCDDVTHEHSALAPVSGQQSEPVVVENPKPKENEGAVGSVVLQTTDPLLEFDKKVFEDDHLRVWCFVEPIECPYTPDNLKSDCKMKVRLDVYDKDKIKTYDEELSVNLALFLRVLPQVSKLSAPAIQSFLVEPDGVKYVSEMRALPYLSSEILVRALYTIANIEGLASTEPEENPTRDTLFIPTGSADVDFRWFGDDRRVRSWNLMPGIPTIPTQPLNLHNFVTAVNKRFLSRYSKLSTEEYYQVRTSILQELSELRFERQPIYCEGCFYAYVDALHDRKHLTVSQTKDFYAYAAICEEFLAENPSKLMLALMSVLEYDMKSFIKDEVIEITTTLRFIQSPEDFVKVVLGPFFEFLDHHIFYKSTAPFRNHCIKKKIPADVKDILIEFDKRNQRRDGTLVQTDISAFESSQKFQAISLEFLYYEYYAEHDPVAKELVDTYHMFLNSLQRCCNSRYYIEHGPMRLSGMNNTSDGNYLLNHINCNHVIPTRCRNEGLCDPILDFIFEGDDGLLSLRPGVDPQVLANMSVFPLKLVQAAHVFDLSFCGWHLDDAGNRRVSDPEMFMSKICTYFDHQKPSLRTAYEMVTLRLFSAQYQYPNDPYVLYMIDQRDKYFKNVKFEIRRKVYDRYIRENWYKFAYMSDAPPYLSQYNDETGRMKRICDFIDPSKLTELTAEQVARILDKRESDLSRDAFWLPRFIPRWILKSTFWIFFHFIVWWFCYYRDHILDKFCRIVGTEWKPVDDLCMRPPAWTVFKYIFKQISTLDEIRAYYIVRYRFGPDISFSDPYSNLMTKLTKRISKFMHARVFKSLSNPDMFCGNNPIQTNIICAASKLLPDDVVMNVSSIAKLVSIYQNIYNSYDEFFASRMFNVIRNALASGRTMADVYGLLRQAEYNFIDRTDFNDLEEIVPER